MRTSPVQAILHGVTSAALAILLLGCGKEPLTPAPFAPGPQVLVVGDDGAVTYRQASSLEPADDNQGEDRAVTVSKQIDGEKGGWLECGRFLLAIPSGAFESVSTVTMSMPDTLAMVVDL